MFIIFCKYLLTVMAGVMLVGCTGNTVCPDTSLPECDGGVLQESAYSWTNPQVVDSGDKHVVYADSLVILSVASEQEQSSGSFLYAGWVVLWCGAGACIWFFSRRWKLKGRVDSLVAEKQMAEERLEREIYRMSKSRHQLFTQYIIHTSIYKEIARLIVENRDRVCNVELLSETQWEELYAAINVAADDFTGRLQREFPQLKAEDVRFCCLVKAGFKYADIARVMGRTPNMMYKRREIVVKRMHLDELVGDWGEYIRAY